MHTNGERKRGWSCGATRTRSLVSPSLGERGKKGKDGANSLCVVIAEEESCLVGKRGYWASEGDIFYADLGLIKNGLLWVLMGSK